MTIYDIDFHKILLDERVITGLSLLTVTILSSLTANLNLYIDKSKKEKSKEQQRRKEFEDEQTERLNSIKRSMLRSEYLSIYNSTEFTYSEKYMMTREIIKSYMALNGNTYVKELDERLCAHVIMSDKEGKLYDHIDEVKDGD